MFHRRGSLFLLHNTLLYQLIFYIYNIPCLRQKMNPDITSKARNVSVTDAGLIFYSQKKNITEGQSISFFHREACSGFYTTQTSNCNANAPKSPQKATKSIRVCTARHCLSFNCKAEERSHCSCCKVPELTSCLFLDRF